MSHLMSLVKRDIKIFYRTRGNIFFSLLSVLILVVLHFVIFRQVYTDNWVAVLSAIPGLYVERTYLQWISDNLMFSAIIPIGAMTISLTTLGLLVADRETNALSDFLVSPIRRGKLMTSYLTSSFIVCLVLLSGFVVFFQVFLFIVYGTSFTLLQFGMIFLTMIGSLIFANVFMLLILSFLKTQQSMSAASIIIGVMSGFVTGAYIPLGMFGETIGNVFSALPFAQITTLSRGAFLHNLESATPLTHDLISGDIARGFGIELWLGSTHVSTLGVIVMVARITLILLLCLMIRFAKMKKSD